MLPMKKIIVKISALFIAMFAMSACSSEEVPYQEAPGLHTGRLIWEGGIQECDGTRIPRQDQDGDVIYLRYKTTDSYVDGFAIYDAETEEWEFTYHGSLTVGEISTCTAFFINGTTDVQNTQLPLTPHTLVCSTIEGTYCKEDPNLMKLTAHLTPVTSRLRFKGTPGQGFLLSGLKHFSAFNRIEHTLAPEETPLELTVGEDGYTPFVYALPLEDRTISVSYDFQTYQTTCESPVLDPGISGYMLLPTEEAHNGWSLVKVELPTLSAVTPGVPSDVAIEVNAEVLSLGNGTLSDAGFVYAETPNPTVDSQKISCGTATILTTTLHDLAPRTDYYVRAYAVNERGISYSEELKVSTTATPTLPTVRTGKALIVQPYSISVSATIEALGEVSEVTQHGHVWSTTPNPTTAVSTKTQHGPAASTGEYISELTDLTPHTTYYVRAYAINAVGTSYGEEISVTTDYAPVELTTSAATSITSKSASVGGTITFKGGHTIVERGVCWATKESPTVTDNLQPAYTSEDLFIVSLTGLQEKTLYYARIYVRTESGAIFYGNGISFTTSPKEVDITIDGVEDEQLWNK